MNREQAENLLAQLVFDDLDEATKAELSAYLQTDPELNERLGDMRVVAGLLREGIALDDEPRLSDERRAKVLARLNELPSPEPAKRTGRSRWSLRTPAPLAVAAGLLLAVTVIGLILPSLGAARRTARQMQSNTQLRGLHQSMVMYSQQNDGRYPDDMGVLLDGNYFTPEYAISPRDDTTVPDDFDRYSLEQKKRWIHEHGSYVATSLGEHDDLDTEAVAGFERFGKDKAGVAVAFKDNRVVHMPKDEARALIEAQTGQTVEQLTEDFARIGGGVPASQLALYDGGVLGDSFAIKALPDGDGEGRVRASYFARLPQQAQQIEGSQVTRRDQRRFAAKPAAPASVRLNEKSDLNGVASNRPYGERLHDGAWKGSVAMNDNHVDFEDASELYGYAGVGENQWGDQSGAVAGSLFQGQPASGPYDLEPIPDAQGFSGTVSFTIDGRRFIIESGDLDNPSSIVGRLENHPANTRSMTLVEAEAYVMNQRAAQAEAGSKRDTTALTSGSLAAVDQLIEDNETEWDAIAAAEAKILSQAIPSREAEARQNQTVDDLLTRARELQFYQRYDDALEMTNQALFLDPTNPAAQGMKDIIEDVRDLVAQKNLIRERNIDIANQSAQNVEATLPSDELITYPVDWPQLTGLRLAESARESGTTDGSGFELTEALSPQGFTEYANRTEPGPDGLLQSRESSERVSGRATDPQHVQRKLEESVPINFESNRLVNIIDYFRNTTGVNFYVNWPALEKAGIEKDTPITLLLTDVPAEQALRLVLRQAAAETGVDSPDYALVEGIVTISTRDDLQHHGELQPEPEPALEPDPEPQTLAPPVAPPVNPWVMSDKDRLSTFAIDVDTASYAIARRSIAQGHLPPQHTVRMEEFVNAFDYNYPTGKDARDTFTVHDAAAASPFRPELTMLKVGVRGKVIGRDQLKPAHLVLVIDASGSMDTEDRLALVQRSLGMLLEQLGDGDRVSIVAYGTEANLLAEAVSASGDTARAQLAGVIGSIQPRGATNLLGGIELGYQVARRHFLPGGVNRVILCSDGVANVGPADADELLGHAAAYRDHGITFTSIGFGTGSYDDRLLEQLSNRGDGSYLFVGSDDEAKRLFVDDLAATRPTIARDVKIQVDFDPKRVRRYRLIGYENRDIADADFRNDAVDAGEVGSGQSATALYELELLPAADADGPRDIGTVFVRYENPETGKVEEIASRLPVEPSALTVSSAPRFYLAASAVQFAELLRGSEHARHGNLAEVSGVLQGVTAALPLDGQARELLELVERAQGLPPAP